MKQVHKLWSWCEVDTTVISSFCLGVEGATKDRRVSREECIMVNMYDYYWSRVQGAGASIHPRYRPSQCAHAHSSCLSAADIPERAVRVLGVLRESECPILDGAVSRRCGGVQLTVVVTFNIHISLM